MEAFIRDDHYINLERILETCSVYAYDVWRILVGFIRLCSEIPILMKVHLCFLEMLCFFDLFWKERSPLIDLIRSQASSSLIDHRREKRLESSKNSVAEKENIQPSSIASMESTSVINISHNVDCELQKAVLQATAVYSGRKSVYTNHQSQLQRQTDGVCLGSY